MPHARPARRLVVTLAALVAGLTVVVGLGAPASGQATPVEPTPAPRIIGGSIAPPGTWPAQVALYVRYERERFFTCGGTLIDPSWVLTAAHCVVDVVRPPEYEGDPELELSVVVGTQDLARGGQSIPVSRIIVRPSFSYDDLSDDVALIQLARPTDAVRPLAVASPTEIPPSGATLTTAGWGQSDNVPASERSKLRQVDVPALSGLECQAAVNESATELGSPRYHSSHLCTGPIGLGGRGPCYGDSGGPLVWDVAGRQVLVGVVSWGTYCGSPEYPAVFSKVASASRWIAQMIQYGPHRNARDFGFSAARAYLDEDYFEDDPMPIPGEPGAHIAAFHQTSLVTRRAGTVVRLYQAVLGRRAEQVGYDYWRQRLGFSGVSATRVAEVMARSQEFRTTYGSLADEDFVALLFQNVLGRAGAPGDVAYWSGRLQAGESRGRIVLLIADSAENRARSQGEVDTQVVFMNLLGRPPAGYELAQWTGRPVAETARFLIHTVAYARRWRSFFEYEE